jgi:hypothetical protein
MMEIEYHTTEADLFALTQYRMLTRGGWESTIRRHRLIFLFGFIALSVAAWILSQNLVLPLSLIITGILIFAFYPVYYTWMVKSRVSSMYKDPENRAVFDSRTLNAVPEYFEDKSSMGDFKLKWEGITHVEETEEYAFISVQGDPMLIVPKKRLRSGDYQEFIRICRENMNASQPSEETGK